MYNNTILAILAYIKLKIHWWRKYIIYVYKFFHVNKKNKLFYVND